jgi:hypothetical protein
MNQSTNPYHQTLLDFQWWLLEFPLWEEFLEGLHKKMAFQKADTQVFQKKQCFKDCNDDFHSS